MGAHCSEYVELIEMNSGISKGEGKGKYFLLFSYKVGKSMIPKSVLLVDCFSYCMKVLCTNTSMTLQSKCNINLGWNFFEKQGISQC